MSTPAMQSCVILSLNCAKGESSTYAVLSFALRLPQYCLILIQEPWLNTNHQPPTAKGFDMFIPTATNPKCVIYVQKSAQLQPTLAFSESDCFLGIKLCTSSSTFTVYNLYSPGRQHAICHLFHTFQADPNSIICGELNSHHRMWYGHRSGQHQCHLSGDSGLADQLVDSIVGLSLDLQNSPGEYTHFPHNGSAPSIVDLTFTRGQPSNDVLDWTLGEDFGSDHLSIHLHLPIQHPAQRLRL